MTQPLMKRRSWLAAAAAATLGVSGLPARAQALAGLRTRGKLTVAVYNDMPPFNVNGKGIDVALGAALAKAMGLELSLLPFPADDSMNDDLRNMVWKGHYLGYGPADLMLHVPVDRPLMQDNPKVRIFAPYYRERVVIARDLSQVPQMDSLDAFGTRPIAVPGQTLAGWLLIGAEHGRYRQQLLTSYKDGTEAATALAQGQAVAAAGEQSELESVLGGDARFAIEPLPLPQARQGWVVGCAVKSEATDLAQAVQLAMNGLAASGEIKRIFAAGKVNWASP